MAENKSRLGRPPVMATEERQHLLLSAAEKVFVENGYGTSSMEEIARESGMSKKTLYRYYPNKKAIFSALVQNHEISHIRVSPPDNVSKNIQAELRKTIMALAKFILSPRQVKMARLIIAEARNAPELAQQFQEDCLMRSQNIVAELLRNLGVCKGAEADRLADIILGATLGSLQLRALVSGLDLNVINNELEVRIKTTLNLLSPLTSNS